MKTSHILLGIGGIAGVGLLWAYSARPKMGFAPMMSAPPSHHIPPGHHRPHPSHQAHQPPSHGLPHRMTIGGNNIYHHKYKFANIKHQGDTDPYDIGFPTPIRGVRELGPWVGHGACIGKEKRNNQAIYGSCSLC